MLKKINQYKPYQLALILLVVLAVICASIFLYINLLKHGLSASKLAPQTEAFTELYIDNHQTLPTSLETGRIATASFTIHNFEHKNENYAYVVTETLKDESHMISSGAAALAHNKYHSVSFEFEVATTAAKTKITISLPDKNQAIHFFVNTKR